MTGESQKEKMRGFRKRFGAEYFRRVPSRPGVFWMMDAKRKLLFVGKSRNIRERLQAFRYEDRDDLSSQIHNIQWNPCPDMTSSNQLYEELLIRHQPPFNRAYKNDLSYSVGVEVNNSHHLAIYCGPDLTEDTHPHLFNLPFAQKITPALLRSLWKLIRPTTEIDFPSPLTKARAPREVAIPMGQWHQIENLQRSLQDLLGLANINLLNDFAKNIQQLKNKQADSFLISWLESDNKALRYYFLRQMTLRRTHFDFQDDP